MAPATQERPRRGVASRRKVVVDDDTASEGESIITGRPRKDEEEEEDDFPPAPTRPSRSPRKTAAATPSRKTTRGGRRGRESEAVEESQVFSPPPSEAGDPPSPAKRAPPKRRSVKEKLQARKSKGERVSIALDAPDPPQTLPTPRATESPDASRHTTPLADITESALNDQTPTSISRNATPAGDESLVGTTTMLPDQENVAQTPKRSAKMEVTKIDPNVTHLERPMDIVVRTRQLGVPRSREPEGPKARLTITYLILTNFKSYAGRQEVGPFHASFSSVVGPNGSGKSNVIDSLLFVFGFRASKMRQGKLSALIHSSAQIPDLDYCEVEVRFQTVEDQPDGGHVVVPDSQLVISRRAFKNNSSSYYINGKSSNFTAVTTLLKDRGVDLDHKRFLILQGEVESIAQMKPKAANENDDGLLEYLEDIIGTSKYKAPIDEAVAETEALNEVCLEKSNRVQHVEKEKNNLEHKKDKALAYIRDENELVLKQSSLYQIYIAECGDNIQVTEEAIEETRARLDEELERHRDSEDLIKRLEKEHKIGQKNYEKLEKDTQAILKEVTRIDKETVKFEEMKKFLANKTKKLEKTFESSKFGVTDALTQAKNAENDIERIAAEIQELEQESAAAERKLEQIRESLNGKTHHLSEQIAEKQKLLEPWNAKIIDKRSAIAVAQSELDILRERENAGAAAVAETKEKMLELREHRARKASELENCEKLKMQAEKEVQVVRKQLDALAVQEPVLKQKLSSAREKADEARASLSTTLNQGNVLSGLTRLRESGRIDGFHGRLGNLGSIEQKFDVAISTACPSLDNLVVDTVEVGQQCIDYLRKNNLGRANFILLDRLPQRDLSPIETPENVPRLFDLVKCKHDRFLPAFYSVLQNTLVAKDLDQANRIAYGSKRWRVVTLDGQLIDKSGTMSGGGTKVSKGAMSSKITSDVTKDQVVKMELDRDQLETQHADLQREQRTGESRMEELSSQLPQLETQAQKMELELDSIDRNAADVQKRTQELGAEQQPSKSEKNKITSLEKSISSLQRDIEKLQEETSGIEDEIQALQDKIMELGGIKLRSQKAKVDGIREQIDLLQEGSNAAEVNKTKADKQRLKHEKAHTEAVQELEKVSAEQDKVSADIAAQSSNHSGLRNQAEEAQLALEEKKEQLAELKKQLDDQTAELNDTRGAEIEMRNKLEENQKILADNNKRLRYWQEKLGKLSLQNVTDDGEEKEAEPLPELSRDEMEDMDKEELKAAIVSLEERTSQHVELSVLSEYRRRATEYASRMEDLNSALTARESAKKRTDDLRRLRLEGFMEGFSAISLRLKEMYQMITMGGNAELELVDSLDPFAEGILFSVMPPKKSWKNISNLSGGEKTLSSLALVFALHHYKPTPLYVMDEIDAALDFRNVSIVAAYIKERTKNAQFVVISLRNNMFELASRLVGVYKVNHMTKSVTVENRDYIVAQA